MLHKSKNREEVYRLRTTFHMAGVPTTNFKTDKGFMCFETDYVPEALEDYIQCWRIIYTKPLKDRFENLVRFCNTHRTTQ